MEEQDNILDHKDGRRRTVDLDKLRTTILDSLADGKDRRRLNKIINRTSFGLDEELTLDIKGWLVPRLKKIDLPVTEFVVKVGISRATLYLYYHDTIRPSVKVFRKMCEVLNCDYEESVKLIIVRKHGRPAEDHYKVLSMRAAVVTVKELVVDEPTQKEA